MTTDPWKQLADALQAVAADLATTDPGRPITIPDGVLHAYVAVHEARHTRAAA